MKCPPNNKYQHELGIPTTCTADRACQSAPWSGLLYTSQKKLNSAFWLTSASEAEDVVLATAALVVAKAVVAIDTGGLDVTAAGGATTAVVAMLVLVVLVEVEVDEELELKLELVLVLVLVELELLLLEVPAVTATASLEMAEWHCAVVKKKKIDPTRSEKPFGD